MSHVENIREYLRVTPFQEGARVNPGRPSVVSSIVGQDFVSSISAGPDIYPHPTFKPIAKINYDH